MKSNFCQAFNWSRMLWKTISKHIEIAALSPGVIATSLEIFNMPVKVCVAKNTQKQIQTGPELILIKALWNTS